jgi:hypothetical protein
MHTIKIVLWEDNGRDTSGAIPGIRKVEDLVVP